MLLSVLGIFLCAGALAQNVALKGVVKDNTGEKLTGVDYRREYPRRVRRPTATANTRSSAEGSDARVFFLGSETQRVEVGNRTVVDVVMSQTAVVWTKQSWWATAVRSVAPYDHFGRDQIDGDLARARRSIRSARR